MWRIPSPPSLSPRPPPGLTIPVTMENSVCPRRFDIEAVAAPPTAPAGAGGTPSDRTPVHGMSQHRLKVVKARSPTSLLPLPPPCGTEGERGFRKPFVLALEPLLPREPGARGPLPPSLPRWMSLPLLPRRVRPRNNNTNNPPPLASRESETGVCGCVVGCDGGVVGVSPTGRGWGQWKGGPRRRSPARGPLGAQGTATPEVKFSDRRLTHGGAGVLQVRVRRSRMRVWGAKTIRHRRSPPL